MITFFGLNNFNFFKELKEDSCLFIPGKENIILYSCTNYRHAKSEQSILWNDKKLKINWGIKNPIMTHKDKNAQVLSDFIKKNK